jgi:CARDB/Domain of unknown function (DUF4214)
MFRRLSARPGNSAHAAQRSRHAPRFRPTVESLEHRLAPAILFTPEYGAEGVKDPASNGGVLSSPDIHLIFWGSSYWQRNPSPSIADLQTAMTNIISSSYLAGLAEYGTDGKVTYDKTKDLIYLADPPANFTQADVQNVITNIISAEANRGVPTPDKSQVPPFYVVITPPDVSHSNPAAGGYNSWYTWQASAGSWIPTSFAWCGQQTNSWPEKTDLISYIMTHEIAERISAGNGPGDGIVTTHGASWTAGGDYQISDAEAHDYGYRQSNGTLVQSFWSRNYQAYCVPNGLKQAFRINPNADRIDWAMYGNGVLTVNGDQLGVAYPDQIDISMTPSGTIVVNLNGEIAWFEAPVISYECRIASVQVHTGDGRDNVVVHSNVTISVTVDNNAHDLARTTQSDGSLQYTLPLPDVAPCTPAAWAAPLVVSTQTGNQQNATSITTADSTYVNWAICNMTSAPVTSLFHTELLLDGQQVGVWQTSPPLPLNQWTGVQDFNLGQLPAGPHTVTVVADYLNELTESDKNNNTFSYNFTVTPPGLRDISPCTPAGWAGSLVVSSQAGKQNSASSLTTADSAYVDWAITNTGSASITSTFHSELLLDGQQVGTWSTDPPLNLGGTQWVQDFNLGQLPAGTHTLTLVADSLNEVTESNETNNTFSATFTVAPASSPRAGSRPSWLAAVASALTHSAEYYSGIVAAAYHTYLGRPPDAEGLSVWVRHMQGGLTDEHLEANFIGSSEYIQNHGGTGDAWVSGMYRDLLGRSPSQSEVDGWVHALNAGRSTIDIAYGFAASAEREGQRVTADYVGYLGRRPGDAEAAGWVSSFENGSKTNEDVVAGFVGSDEYFANHSGMVLDWFTAAYQALFGQPASQAGPAPSYLAAVVGVMSRSGEHYSLIVSQVYQTCLGRSADAAGLNNWVTQMLHGLSDEHLEASFIGSAEYIQNHGGPGAGWVRGMYRDLLGRTPSQSEVDGWVKALNAGASSTDIAYGFAASAEREGQRVTGNYQQYLGRSPSANEVSGWVLAFESGAKQNEDVVAGFIGSPEYLKQQNGDPLDWWKQAVLALFGSGGL